MGYHSLIVSTENIVLGLDLIRMEGIDDHRDLGMDIGRFRRFGTRK